MSEPTKADLLERIEKLEEKNRKLEEKEQFYEKMGDMLPVLVAYLDKNQIFQYVNKAFVQVLDMELSKIIGQHPQKILSKRNYKQIASVIESALSGNEEFFEGSFVLPDGIPFHFHAQYVPHIIEAEVVGFLAVIEDITIYRQAEEELETTHQKLCKSQERLINAIEVIDDGFVLYNTDDKLVLCNQKYKNLYNKSADLMTPGTSFEEIIRTGAERGEYAEAIGRINDWVEERLENHKNADSMIEQQLSDGTWLKIREKKVENGDTVGFRVDITDYKKTEIELRKIQEELEKRVEEEVHKRLAVEKEKKKYERRLHQSQKMEAIGTLAGGIAHDFNNILTPILGFSELMLSDVGINSQYETFLNEIYVAGNRAKDLVKQILVFARQSEEEFSPINVSTITKEVLKFIRSTIPTSIEIITKLHSDSYILGNATQTHQILMNLTTNSAFAMKENGGTLSVSLADIKINDEKEAKDIGLKAGKFIELIISDTGVGIPSEIINSIFEPYFTTKSVEEGTGMGLAVVHGIVKSFGGTIRVQSKVGKGTKFTIYFPALKSSKITFHKNSEVPIIQGSESILLVDDELPVANMLRLTLERLGYTVNTQINSFQALELFKISPFDFDLVITDMAMPKMTGDKLAIELMKIRPDIPIIICTGFSNKITEGGMDKIGVKALLNKPVLKADLANTVKEVLDEQKAVKGK